MRVLGLDPGSRRTGFGVVERAGSTFTCLHHGHASPPSRSDLPERLHAIAQRVGEVIDQYEPDCVVVEQAFYHESVRSTLVLGHVRGALILTALQRSIAVAEYAPREIKMSVTGSGAASKDQVSFMVRRLLHIKGALQADAADALAVALCHLHRSRKSAPAKAAKVAAQSLAALLEKRTVTRGEAAALLAGRGSGRGDGTLISGGRVIGRRVAAGGKRRASASRRAARRKPR